MTSAAPAAPQGSRLASGILLGASFLAALGPMVTVPALRRLVMEDHGGSPAALHVFVALGMMGGALGAPLLARRAERKASLVGLSIALALLDSGIAWATSCPIPTALVFALRPLHGAASMGLLALLFAQFRRSGGAGLSRGAAATIVALAVGPAVGGFLAKHGTPLPFRLASFVALAQVPLFLAAKAGLANDEPREPAEPPTSLMKLALVLRGPLVVLATQRMAIGGLVGTWALRAREAFHMSDAKVGAGFSVFLLAFAATTLVGGRRLTERVAFVACGGMTLGLAFVGLATSPRAAAFPLLALAGVGAALSYAPSLSRISELSNGTTRVSGMALAHSAGAAGMIAGPLAGAAFDSIAASLETSVRAGAFLCAVGIVHALATAVTTTSRRAPHGVVKTSPTDSPKNEGLHDRTTITRAT